MTTTATAVYVVTRTATQDDNTTRVIGVTRTSLDADILVLNDKQDILVEDGHTRDDLDTTGALGPWADGGYDGFFSYSITPCSLPTF